MVDDLHSSHLNLQPNKVKKGKKKVAAAPKVAKKVEPKKKVVNPLFEKRPRNFGIGVKNIKVTRSTL